MIFFGTVLLNTLIICFAIIIFVIMYLCNSFTYWKRKKMPYIPVPSFIFGHMALAIKEKINIGENIALIYNEIKKKKMNFAGFYVSLKPMFLPIDLELIQSMLITDFNFFEDRGAFYDEDNDPLTANIVNLEGERWKKLRSKVSPNYTASKMKKMFDTLLGCSTELDNILENCIKKQESIDILDVMTRLTIDNISLSAFGVNSNSLKDPNTDFRKYSKLYVDTTLCNLKWFIAASAFPSLMRFFKIPLTDKKVTLFFMTAFQQIMDYRQKNQVIRNDFLDYFMKLKDKEILDEKDNIKQIEEGLSLKELSAHAFIVFFSGYETSSLILTFCLYELAKNQYIQDKCRQEILKVLDEHNSEVSYDALMEMTYMDQILQETLRMYPPLPMLNRLCVKSYNIPGTSNTIDKGTTCVISILGIHRDPEFYPNPERFDPERFTEEQIAKRHPLAYLPFGNGPRICLGIKFALIQIKIGLVKLLRNNTFQLDSRTPSSITFNPKGILLMPKEKILLQISTVSEKLAT